MKAFRLSLLSALLTLLVSALATGGEPQASVKRVKLKVSPNGRWLSSCGDDGTITIWELESGEHQRTLRRDRPYERLDISGVQGLTQAQRASLRALGAIEMAPVPDDRDALRENSQEHTFSS